MIGSLDPLRPLVIAAAGWINQQQQDVIEYSKEENRVLREQLHGRRLRLTDDQRPRLAARAKGLGRKILRYVASFATRGSWTLNIHFKRSCERAWLPLCRLMGSLQLGSTERGSAKGQASIHGCSRRCQRLPRSASIR